MSKFGIDLKKVCIYHRGFKLCFLSDFRPREENYVLLNDESSNIERFGKMLKSNIRKLTRDPFSMNQFGQNFHFFHFPFFSPFFLIDLKRRPLGIRKSSKYS